MFLVNPVSISLLLTSCWVGTLVAGAVIALYIKSLLESYPTRSIEHYERSQVNLDHDLKKHRRLTNGTKIGFRKRSRIAPVKRESYFHDNKLDEHRFLGDALEEKKVNASSLTPSQHKVSNSVPKPVIHPIQKNYELNCREIISKIVDEKEKWTSKRSTEDEVLDGHAKCKILIKSFVTLLKNMQKDFNFDRPGYITTMVLCCNVIIELDALSLVKSLGELDPEMKDNATTIIETVVPNIWSI